jgi:hypothetical protein
MVSFLTVLSKTMGVFGRIFTGLFSWPVLIADIIMQLTIGKGIFEMLWDVIKKLAGWLGWITPDEDKNKKTARMQYEIGAPLYDVNKNQISDALAKMIAPQKGTNNTPAATNPAIIHINLNGQQIGTTTVDLNKSLTNELGFVL